VNHVLQHLHTNCTCKAPNRQTLQRHNTENLTQRIVRPQSQFPHSCVSERSVCLFCCSKYGQILEIYKSLTDTWMWKLGLRPRNSFSGNTWVGFLCSVGWNHVFFAVFLLGSNLPPPLPKNRWSTR
jgi:hypothetical protein